MHEISEKCANFVRRYAEKAMKGNVKDKARQVLDNYLQQNNRRKTPERYAVLDAVYSLKGPFTIEQLGQRIEATQDFTVSRATLYNTINLLARLRLVAIHYFQQQVCYTAAYTSHTQCLQICTFCGKTADIRSATLNKVIDDLPLRRFRMDSSTLYVYGVCSSCQAKITKENNKQQKIKNKPDNRQ